MDKLVPYIYNQYRDIFELQLLSSPGSLSLVDTPYYFKCNQQTMLCSLRSIDRDIVTNNTIKSVTQMIKLIRLLGVPK